MYHFFIDICQNFTVNTQKAQNINYLCHIEGNVGLIDICCIYYLKCHAICFTRKETADSEYELNNYFLHASRSYKCMERKNYIFVEIYVIQYIIELILRTTNHI